MTKTLDKNNVLQEGGSSCIPSNEIANPFTNSKNQLYGCINTSFEECQIHLKLLNNSINDGRTYTT